MGRIGNLLSVDGRLITANDDRVMCSTTCEAEIALLERSLLPEGEERRQATAAFLEKYGETKVVVDNRVVPGAKAVE
ncbi:MAG: hypothetical protein ACYTG3_10845 [Planctomycetota bacterium]|jgi:hypothetical protein